MHRSVFQVNSSSPYYPTSPSEWIEWIEDNLEINREEGKLMLETDEFPYVLLEEYFKKEFTVEDGYSSEFIPALVRNIKGLVSWAFGEGPEPLWTGSDDPD
jgi:hypothetical protein